MSELYCPKEFGRSLSDVAVVIVTKIVSFNGFEGVRAELVDTPTSKSSDSYIVSELKDFIHI